MANFTLRPSYLAIVQWNSRGSCGNPGCADASCVCSLCKMPIGISEDDPRRANHDEDCFDCDLCRDDVPIILFRGKGKATQQAQFHTKCFEKISRMKEGQRAPQPTGSAKD